MGDRNHCDLHVGDQYVGDQYTRYRLSASDRSVCLLRADSDKIAEERGFHSSTAGIECICCRMIQRGKVVTGSQSLATVLT